MKFYRRKIIILIIPVILGIVVFSFLYEWNKIRTASTNEYQKIILEPGKVQLIIEPEFEIYYPKQDIWFLVSLHNLTTEDYIMTDYLFDPLDIHLHIIDPSGRSLPSGIRVTKALVFDYEILKPGEKIERLVPGEFFMINSDNKLGQYTVSANFQGVRSNLVKINMVSPEGFEKEIFDFVYSKAPYFIPKDSNDVEDLLRLLNKYPNSKYAPQLYLELVVFDRGFFDESFKEDLFKNYFPIYHNRYGTNHMVPMYKVFLDNKPGNDLRTVRDKLRELGSVYRDSPLDLSIESFIENNYPKEDR